IENFKKLEQLLQPFIDDLGHGYLWDMSNSPFRNLGFDILKKYSELLKNDTTLQEFAELLGRQSTTSQEVEKQIIDETIIKSEYHPKPAQSGNIVGFEYSNDISRVLPSEVGLLNDPDLENLFYFKFVEKQLLSYRYSQDVASTHEEIRQKEIEVSKSKDLTGPIIICVDTSGSMQGVPEQTAKIATFALAKIAIKQHRKCFLISFSTGIETLDMSDFKKQNALDSLVSFLNKSFNGGTDATPALRECLRQLKTKNYKNSDVLMISDFVMGNLPQDVVSAIQTEQDNGTSFYSLVIGESANNKAIECFDENISYNPYNEVSRQEFYRKIRKMAVEKQKRIVQ
ncbi:MAG: VWA domain-containing protein, partial [Bacteroidales bacterium]|nr:VWA domain-containing protein [Bacteroidales bacterium]